MQIIPTLDHEACKNDGHQKPGLKSCQSLPGQPVAYDYRLLSMNYGLLYGMVWPMILGSLAFQAVNASIRLPRHLTHRHRQNRRSTSALLGPWTDAPDFFSSTNFLAYSMRARVKTPYVQPSSRFIRSL